MKMSLNWLLEFVETDLEPESLARRLTETGTEVEGMEKPCARFKGAVSARIEKLEIHPERKDLYVAEIETGTGKAVCVSAAPNLELHACVPYGPPGSVLADGTKIGKRDFDGIKSEGMMLSAEEIGLPDVADEFGILKLDPWTPPGKDIRKLLGLDDLVFDLSITPNRGDLLSIKGLAVEVAGIVPGSRLLQTKETFPSAGNWLGDFEGVRLEDPDCSLYVLGYADSVSIRPSPVSSRVRLCLAGMRPVSNIVDATNLVMLSTGQPLHAFDADLLPGKEITVRSARDGETIVTLDGKERSLTTEDLLITSGGVPIALAGVMGGLHTEINENTRVILIESANFDSIRVSRTSRRLSLPSEASYRYARIVDPQKAKPAVCEIFGLLSSWKAARPLGMVVEGSEGEKFPKTVPLEKKTLEKILLTDDQEMASGILKGLGFEEAAVQKSRKVYRVPSYRPDVSIEEDLVEEVARVWGYDKIPSRLPLGTREPGDRTDRIRCKEALRGVAMARGYVEVVTYSFISPEMLGKMGVVGADPRARALPLANPISRDQSVMRTLLAPGLLKAVESNLRSGWRRPIRLFEVGAVFLEDPSTELGVSEKLFIGGVACPGRDYPSPWGKEAVDDFFSVKGDVEALAASRGLDVRMVSHEEPFGHAGQTAAILLEGESIGYLCRIKPSLQEKLSIPEPVYLFEMDMEHLINGEPARFGEPFRYPAVYRDISLLAEKETPSEVVACDIRKEAAETLSELRLFDVYEGEGIPAGKRSLAFSLAYRSAERTLRDDEVDEAHERLRENLSRKGYVLR
ncbi:MAG: Phenylalanine--tRNA ligase beta subunit [Synergistales bacterium 54_9]|nr:MAG: Phenylalanine--tRNA ligase beta subunit [Synergistales bacterium 54_9]